MKKIATILFIGIILNSCSNNDNLDSENLGALITSIKIDLINAVQMEIFDFQFEYDYKKRLVKKTTAHLIQQNGSFNYINLDVYTTLTYNNNNVTIEDFSTSNNYPLSKNTNYYTLNSKNQITTREIPNISNSERTKKMFYKYANNKLTEITTTYPNRPYDVNIPYYSYILTYSEKFYYDSNGNLSKTEYYEQHDDLDVGDKTIRTFENHDTSFNPTKRLFLLEEYFYRSLSNNNFRKHTKKTYNMFNDLISFSETSFSFNYDSSGNIIVN